MVIIKIDNIGDIAILDEFRDIYFNSNGFKLCHTSTKPSEIFAKLQNDCVVILHGDYQKAQYMLDYINHFEDGLAPKNNSALKRTRLYRLNYIAYMNTFPMFDNVTEEHSFQEWLWEDMQGCRFLLPARRYNRILTDIKRATDGIYLEAIKCKIYIRPFVYVPFDNSVPEMFKSFAELIQNKTVIDIGTGTGVLAILAAQMGAESVTASDINGNAIECAKINIRASGIEAKNIIYEVIYSDLFENIKNTYDVIIFNAPWVMGTPKNLYEIAIYDKGYELLNRFIEQTPKYLNENGVILLQYSDISQKNGDGSIDNLHIILQKNGLYIADNKSILRRNRLYGMMERVYVFVIKKV
ncbi:MAG: methyltransferase [Oscillospiraceae bacterium]|nr:methyltransferase [Oscillospiraceae bacterium]